MKTMIKSLCLVALITISAQNAVAQDLKSILGGLVKQAVGDKTTTEATIIGTWTYTGPECQFESENMLAKAGGEVAAQTVEEKMLPIYKKTGIDGCQYTFNSDKTFSCTIKGKTTSGTYTFDNEAKTITMKSRLGIKTVAYVTVTGSTMSLVFNADKLMSALKVISGTLASASTTAATISEVAKSYSGMRIGFELKKQ